MDLQRKKVHLSEEKSGWRLKILVNIFLKSTWEDSEYIQLMELLDKLEASRRENSKY